MFGVHPDTPGLGNYHQNGNACFDGKFQYTTVNLDQMYLPPERGPILKLRIPVKDLLLSSELCGFCQIVVKLDTNGNMAKRRYDDAQVDMQLFYPAKYSGTWLLYVMQVTLTLESKRRKKRGVWRNTKLLAFLPLYGKVFISAPYLGQAQKIESLIKLQMKDRSLVMRKLQ